MQNNKPKVSWDDVDSLIARGASLEEALDLLHDPSFDPMKFRGKYRGDIMRDV